MNLLPRDAIICKPLRGQAQLVAALDDESGPWPSPQRAPEMPLEEKSQKCRDLAEFICRYIKWENIQEVIRETAIDLMDLPDEALEGMYKRFKIDAINACLKALEGSENDPTPKPLTRFQILKKDS